MKKIRMILPMLAIAFGAVGAAVSVANANVSLDEITLSFQTSPCRIDGICTTPGTVSCASAASQIEVFDRDNNCSLVDQTGTFEPAD